MDDVLVTIRQLLLDNGYTNVLIVYSSEDTSTDQTSNRIVLEMPRGSSQGNRVPTQRFAFKIRVRDSNKATSLSRAKAIFNLLKNNSFQSNTNNPVTIHDIQGTPPYFWGIFPKSLNIVEYAMDMEALISNDDANI